MLGPGPESAAFVHEFEQRVAGELSVASAVELDHELMVERIWVVAAAGAEAR